MKQMQVRLNGILLFAYLTGHIGFPYGRRCWPMVLQRIFHQHVKKLIHTLTSR